MPQAPQGEISKNIYKTRQASMPGRRYRVPRWGRLTITLSTLVATIIVVVILGFTWNLRQNISSSSIPGLGPDVESGDAMNILIIGSDERDGSIADSSAAGKRSDSMVLAHFEPDNGMITGIQIPRDTMVSIPDCAVDNLTGYSGEVQINSLLGHGESCLVDGISDLTGMTINHFVDVNFGGFVGIVDALGGVDICLPQSINDPFAELDLPAGCQRVDGQGALALARTRHGVGDGSDLARIEHQQEVMDAIIKKINDDSIITNPSKLYNFVDAATSSLTVDENLNSTSDFIDLAHRVNNAGEDNIEFVQLPSEPYPYDYNRVRLSAEGEEFLSKFR